MTVLFVGNEIESFNLIGLNQTPVTTGGTDYDTDFTRSAILQKGGLADHGISGSFAAQTDFWFHCTVAFEKGVDTNYDWPLINLVDSVSGETTMRIDGINGNFRFEYWNGSSFTTRVTSVQFQTNVPERVDIHCKIHDTLGVFAFYVDEVLIDEFTGDTNLYASSQVDHFILKGGNQSPTVGEGTHYSEVIVADESTIGWRLATIAPTGVGATGAWTGLWSDVDEAIADDTDFLTSDTTAQVETMVAGNLSATAAAMEVVALAVTARIRKGNSGVAQAQMAVRTNALDFFSATLALDNGFIPIVNIWETNPDTAAVWTPAEIDAVEIGVKSIT